MWKVNWSTWHKHGTKKRVTTGSPTGIEPTTTQTLGSRSIHWATRTHGEQGHLTEFIWHPLLNCFEKHIKYINFKDVRTNCFCASLLHTQIHMPCHSWAHALSHKNKQIIRQMAIARALTGFNDLGRSVTLMFLSMDHFLYWFSTFREKMKKSID